MKIPLLTLGLALVCIFQVKATDVKDINFHKLVGRWYPLLLASSDVGSNSAAFLHSIDVKADNLIIYFTLRRNGECSRVPLFAYKVEKNKYKLQYPGNNVVYLEDADPKNYLLLYTTNEIHGMKNKGVELYSRQKGGPLNQVIKSKFKEIYLSHGLQKENVIDLINTDPCKHPLE